MGGVRDLRRRGELPDLGNVEAVAGEGKLEVRSEPIPDDWADRWRDFHEPTSIAGGRVVIRPSWRNAPPGDVVDVQIDPGQAFGTGAHPTTRMCVELLVQLADDGRAAGPLADLGTGSAVLAIVAAKLGFAPVTGVDLELPALEAARGNANANDVEVELRRVNLERNRPPRLRSSRTSRPRSWSTSLPGSPWNVSGRSARGSSRAGGRRRSRFRDGRARAAAPPRLGRLGRIALRASVAPGAACNGSA